MTAITISDGKTTITMPQTNQVTDVGELEYKEKKMIGGRIIRKIIGFRPGFTYTYNYVPADTISALTAMLRTGSFFTVNYFDVDGTDKSGTFVVEYPTFEVFDLVDNIAVWYNCTLTIRSQDVT